MVETWTNSSKYSTTTFSGVLLGVRRRGTSTSFVVRNLVLKLGVEMRFNLYSPLLKDVRVISKAEVGKNNKTGGLRRVRRAKLYCEYWCIVRFEMRYGADKRLLRLHYAFDRPPLKEQSGGWRQQDDQVEEEAGRLGCTAGGSGLGQGQVRQAVGAVERRLAIDLFALMALTCTQ
jgi:ribosomal protein L19